MGIFLTLFYIVTAYLTPTMLFGTLAQYHIEVLIAGLALSFSLVHLSKVRLSILPQTYAVLGITVAVGLSMALNGLGLGLTLTSLLGFIPTCIIFFFIVLNFRSKRSLQLLILVLFATAAYTILQGYLVQQNVTGPSPWVIGQMNAEGVWILRSRGVGFLNDPNDLSQFLVGLIPCMFFFWRRGSAVRNVFLVWLPICYLLYGMFMTHSRGGMVALLAMAIVASRRKIGLLPAIVTGGVLFLGLSAVGWSGGREVSAESGADRLEAWSTGLQLIRSHPLFGVGFERFGEFFYITAHNTVVVCCAELGVFGLFFWLLMIVPTLRDASVTTQDPNQKKPVEEPTKLPWALQEQYATADLNQGTANASMLFASSGAATLLPHALSWQMDDAAVEPERPAFLNPESDSPIPDAEIRRLASIMLVSLAGFLTAGWFLSRAYTMVLFCYIGLATAVYRLALERNMVPAPWPMGRAARFAAIASFVLILVVYIMLRLQHFLHV